MGKRCAEHLPTNVFCVMPRNRDRLVGLMSLTTGGYVPTDCVLPDRLEVLL